MRKVLFITVMLSCLFPASSLAHTLSGTAYDETSGVKNVHVTFTGPKSGDICIDPENPTAWTCEWQTNNLPDGVYTIKAEVWDNAGNKAQSIQDLEIKDGLVATAASQAPKSTIEEPEAENETSPPPADPDPSKEPTGPPVNDEPVAPEAIPQEPAADKDPSSEETITEEPTATYEDVPAPEDPQNDTVYFKEEDKAWLESLVKDHPELEITVGQESLTLPLEMKNQLEELLKEREYCLEQKDDEWQLLACPILLDTS